MENEASDVGESKVGRDGSTVDHGEVKQKKFSGYKLNAQHQEMRALGAQWNDYHHRVQWA